MKERQFEFVQNRRYYQNEIVGKKRIILALHGYGQLAQYFYRKFNSLTNDYGLVIPEGPHRFYLGCISALHYRQLLSTIAHAYTSAVGRAAAAVNQGLARSNPSRLRA